MPEYIEKYKLMDHIELNAREHEESYDAWQILGDVEDFPAADAEPVKHGRWLQPKSGECFCSECKTLGSPQWKRCPVCEAKMTTE